MKKNNFNPDPDVDLIQHVNDALAKAIIAIPSSLIFLTEAQLFKKVNPTPMDYALRVSFWKEYELVMMRGGSGKINCTDVCRGICTTNHFYHLLKKPERAAWLIRPKQTYQKEMEAILARGTERLWELIELPIYNSKGAPLAAMAGIVLQAIKQVEDRVKGMAVQRSMSINTQVASSENVRSLESMDQVNARIKELEGVISASRIPGGDSNDKDLPKKAEEPEAVELCTVPEWQFVNSQPAEQEKEGSPSGSLPLYVEDEI